MVQPKLPRANLENTPNIRKPRKPKIQTKITQVFTVEKTSQKHNTPMTSIKRNKRTSKTKVFKSSAKFIQSILKIRSKPHRSKPENTTESKATETDTEARIPKTILRKLSVENLRPRTNPAQHLPIARIVKKFERWRNPPNTSTQGKLATDKPILDQTIGTKQNSHARLGHGD